MELASRLVWSFGCCALLACSGSAKTGGSQLGNVSGAGSVAPAGGGAGGALNGGPPGAGGGVVLDLDGGPGAVMNGGAGGGLQIITSLPPGFTATDVGGFQLGGALGGGAAGGAGGSAGAAAGGSGGGNNGNCGNVLLGVARDFKREDEGGNPDFESPTFWGNTVTKNLVAGTLGPDQKPVYASQCELSNVLNATACPYGAETTTKDHFDQWYRDTPSVNLPFAVSLYLAPQAGGVFTFQSLHYYPLDNAGFGLSGKDKDGSMHNFGFTTEIHTQFSYQGGESFKFQGDDDVWVFINGKMTVDLGGLHPAMLGTVDLDASAAELGLVKGNVYSLDLFHAERHTDQSTFRIDTNLSFVNCGTTESGPK